MHTDERVIHKRIHFGRCRLEESVADKPPGLGMQAIGGDYYRQNFEAVISTGNRIRDHMPISLSVK